MSVRLVLAATSLPLLLAAAPPRPNARVDPATKEACRTLEPRMTRTVVGDMLRRGNDGVTFDLHLGVVRHVDGCVVPAVLRRDVDGRGAGSSAGPGPDTSARTLVRPLGR